MNMLSVCSPLLPSNIEQQFLKQVLMAKVKKVSIFITWFVSEL